MRFGQIIRNNERHLRSLSVTAKNPVWTFNSLSGPFLLCSVSFTCKGYEIWQDRQALPWPVNHVPPPLIYSRSTPPPLSGVNYSATTTAAGGGGGGKVHWRSFLKCSAEDRTIDHPTSPHPPSPRDLYGPTVCSSGVANACVLLVWITAAQAGPATHQGRYWLLLRWNTHTLISSQYLYLD